MEKMKDLIILLETRTTSILNQRLLTVTSFSLLLFSLLVVLSSSFSSSFSSLSTSTSPSSLSFRSSSSS